MFVKFTPACERVVLFDCLNFRINPNNRFDYHIELSIVRLSIDVLIESIFRIHREIKAIE